MISELFSRILVLNRLPQRDPDLRTLPVNCLKCCGVFEAKGTQKSEGNENEKEVLGSLEVKCWAFRKYTICHAVWGQRETLDNGLELKESHFVRQVAAVYVQNQDRSPSSRLERDEIQ
ncbi:hypothetical protein CAEBREN_05547 [Caenorhabditis brenneri]|uniref:Uncharacterized protein n=1 Tax=Caenorhabditis brenneri TaxID=135651 RepID=G0P411_CAEBE|nr:hypothetical protein CAEBREN_05547 [Caenorhabditis brenneri]